MAEACARLRSDLEIRPESSDPQSPVVVKDPVTRRFYRFTWVQACVLHCLDGSNTAAEIAEAASAVCSLQVEQKQVEDFIVRLQQLLLLDSALSWSRLNSLRVSRHRVLDSILSIKIHAVNPDRLLTFLDKRLGGFFFSGIFLTMAAVSLAAGVILTILNWEDLSASLDQILTLSSIPLILVVAFAVITAHELAHGLTLKHFGGRVNEMGFLLIYFIPGFYCNVSDAWLLRKRERMLVSAAGGFFQLVIWSWAVILWRLLAQDFVGSQVCLVVIVFAGVQTLFNFNPLIKLDGYYLLSDYLEIPNLRQKAFDFLKDRLRPLFTRPRAGAPRYTGREKRIYTAFGALSFGFSAGLVLFLMARLGSWMVAEYQAWGLLMISALALLAIPSSGAKPAAPEASRAQKPAVRSRKKLYWLITLGVLCVAAVMPWELKIAGDFMILPNAVVQISPQVSGTLRVINVDEGSPVKKDQVLAEIENFDLSNTYEETRGELESRRATFRLLKAGTRTEEIDRARRAVDTKVTELENAGRVDQERGMLQDTISKKDSQLKNVQSIFDRSKSLYQEGLIPRNELEASQTAFEVAQKELAEARGQLRVLDERTDAARKVKTRELAQARSDLKLLLAGSRKESIQEVEAQVVELEQKLNILGRQLEELRIKSPIDGQVTTPYLKNKIGMYINKGDPFCQVADAKLVIIDMPIPEKEIGEVTPGYRIVLKVRTYPGRTFTAHVTTISPVAIEGNQQHTVVIRGELANEDGALKSGMTGVGKILCGKRLIGNLVTRRLIRWLRTEFWEYLP